MSTDNKARDELREDQEIDGIVAQYKKDPRRFIGTIQGRTLDDALLEYRNDIVAIGKGKSNGLDVQGATDKLMSFVDAYVDSRVKEAVKERDAAWQNTIVEATDNQERSK